MYTNYYGIISEECFDSGGESIACASCDFSGNYDNDDDYGMDACDYPDGLVENGVLTIDHANCPFEMAKLLTDGQKEWISTFSAQISSMLASQARDLINKGYVVDDSLSHATWDLQTVLNCGLGEGIDQAQEE